MASKFSKSTSKLYLTEYIYSSNIVISHLCPGTVWPAEQPNEATLEEQAPLIKELKAGGVSWKEDAESWIQLLGELKDQGLFVGDFLDKALSQFCFMNIIH